MVDVGTNIGDSASLFPHWGIEVFGFDPMPSNRFWLHLNKQANAAGGIDLPLHIFAGGASDRDADIDMTDTGSSGSTNVMIPGHEQINAKFAHVHSIKSHVFRVSDQVKKHIGMLKIDCEGHEPEAFRGAVRLVCDHGVDSLFFEFVASAIIRSSQVSPVAFLKLVTSLGFQCPDLLPGKEEAYAAKHRGRDNVFCRRTAPPSKNVCEQARRLEHMDPEKANNTRIS